MKEKTVREWLNELPEPIRTRALKNIIEQRGIDYLNSDSYQGLGVAFVFKDTQEGAEYWLYATGGNYSEACALLGETLQTEQTEPENEILKQAKDQIAKEEYAQIGWFILSDSQCAYLVDKVAIRYAELVNNQKQ